MENKREKFSLIQNKDLLPKELKREVRPLHNYKIRNKISIEKGLEKVFIEGGGILNKIELSIGLYIMYKIICTWRTLGSCLYNLKRMRLIKSVSHGGDIIYKNMPKDGKYYTNKREKFSFDKNKHLLPGEYLYGELKLDKKGRRISLRTHSTIRKKLEEIFIQNGGRCTLIELHTNLQTTYGTICSKRTVSTNLSLLKKEGHLIEYESRFGDIIYRGKKK